jgi:hypothetical protein
MDAESRARSRAEVVDEVSKWGVGGGIILMALFPLALPILILTLVALLPLVVPLIALGLAAGVVATPIVLIRKLSPSVRKLRPPRPRHSPPEPAPRHAAEV